jgi:hypothetical protein
MRLRFQSWGHGSILREELGETARRSELHSWRVSARVGAGARDDCKAHDAGECIVQVAMTRDPLAPGKGNENRPNCGSPRRLQRHELAWPTISCIQYKYARTSAHSFHDTLYPLPRGTSAIVHSSRSNCVAGLERWRKGFCAITRRGSQKGILHLCQ